MRSFAAIPTVITLITAGSLILLASFSSPEEKKKNRAASSGELSFTIRTITANGNYAPKHVMAIWVESNDVFVKTRKAMASQRKQYLYTWAPASNLNTVDAITGHPVVVRIESPIETVPVIQVSVGQFLIGCVHRSYA